MVREVQIRLRGQRLTGRTNWVFLTNRGAQKEAIPEFLKKHVFA
jgi:hypothetical protein